MKVLRGKYIVKIPIYKIETKTLFRNVKTLLLIKEVYILYKVVRV